MNISIVASASNEINNKHIFSLIKNRDKNKNHIIIAPDRSLFSLEKRLFESTGEKCFFDVNVMSLSRLSKGVLLNQNKNILSKQSGVALVKKILEENKSELQAFSKASNYIGFASSLFETICFYKSCNVSPSEIFVDDSRTFSNLKQKDIKLVYEEYEKYLSSDYTDSFNQLKLFADKIGKDTFPNTIFYFVEFDDFTRLMYNIIARLGKFCDGLYVCATFGKGQNNSNIYSNKVYYDLIDTFKCEGLEYKINQLGAFEDETKAFLASNLLAYTPKKCDLKNSNISIRSFETIEEEIKFTIADIYSSVLSSKLDFSNYTIVVPSLADYKQGLISEMGKYGIPYYIDESGILIDNHFIRLLFDICKIISTKDYRLSDISNILKSPILGFDMDSVSQYDGYLKKVNAISDMCLNESKIDSEEIKQFIDLIKTKRELIVSNLTFGECLDICKDIFDYICARGMGYISSLDAIDSRVYAQVVNKFDKINKDILGVFGGVETTFEKYLEIYKSYFASTNISLPPIASNTLFVADFNVSYVSSNKHIYILGNNEGKLPKMQLDNGLVTDDEIASLPNANRLSPTIAMLNARKTFKLFEMMFKYEDSLKLSLSLSSSDGKMYPNALVNSFLKIGDLDIVDYSGVLDTISRNFYSLDNSNVAFNNLTPKIAGENILRYLADWEVFSNNVNYRHIVSSLYGFVGENIRKIVEGIGIDKGIMKLDNINFFKNSRSSISQIETYNMCPYLHFGRYGLRLKEIEESKLKPNDIGTIIHEVLSKMVPIIITKSDDIEYLQTLARNKMDRVLSKDDYKDIVSNKSNTFVLKALYRELDRIIVAVAREINHSNFIPKYYEYRFDIIMIDDIQLKGFIDRIDEKDDGFLILDYKTGDNSFKNFNDVVSGKKLQLLVYAKAFETLTGKKAKGAFYFPISNSFGDDSQYRLNGVMLKDDSNIVDMDSGLSTSDYKSDIVGLKTTSTGKIYENSFYKNLCLSRDDFDYLLDYAMKQVRISIGKIRDGYITPMPLVGGGKSACDYCKFKALCNYNGECDREEINVENITKLKEIGELDGGIQA